MKTPTPTPTVDSTADRSEVTYTITRAHTTPELQGLWEGSAWAQVPALEVNHFIPESISRHPVTQAKIACDASHLYVIFQVQDQHVRSRYTHYQDNVCGDSCVEFFVKPLEGQGYFNFEVNCGGTMLLYYIIDPRRKEQGGFVDARPVPYEWAQNIRIYHSQPRTTRTTIHSPLTWTIEMAIPLDLLSHFAGPVSTAPGTIWHGNLYKCGGDRRYKHWASWSPLSPTEEPDFHQPKSFGQLVLGE